MNNMVFRVRSALSFFAGPLLLTAAASAISCQETGTPRTAAERSEYRQTTRYDEVMSFLREVTDGNQNMYLTSMGNTSEGRSIPLVVVGAVNGPSPEAVLATGKTRVYVQGGIHAGEISGKEALLILLRELADGQHEYWTDSLVLLIDPLYNADGNEQVSPTNRRGQNGPVEGMGQRANAMGLDLNRDQMKLDAPESRALVRLYTEYDPHLAVDLHTTNGSHHGYHLTYAPPLPPATPVEIDSYLRDQWLPEVTRAVKEDTGWDMYYYGGARPARGDQEAGWYTFSHMRVQAPVQVASVETFQVDSVTTSQRDYEGHRAQQAFGAYMYGGSVVLEPGTVVVPMDQKLARVAFMLLEPRSDDGLVAWGLLSDVLEGGAPYPIRRAPAGSDPRDPRSWGSPGPDGK